MCTILYKEYDDTLRLVWYFQKAAGNGTKVKMDPKFYRKLRLPNLFNDVLLRVEFYLDFRRVKKDDEGWYTCHARNKIGYKSKRTYLRVTNPIVTGTKYVVISFAPCDGIRTYNMVDSGFRGSGFQIPREWIPDSRVPDS